MSIVRRTGLWLVVALSLLPTGIVRADTVEGQVVDGVTGQPVAQTQVAFMVRQGGQLSEVLRKTTDAEGRFAFSGPFLSAGLGFVLVAFHRDVPYPSVQMEVGAQRGVIMEVYEPTSDPTGLHVASHSLFFSLETSGLEALQLIEMHNDGTQTYVGRSEGEVRQVTEFYLPEGAFSLQSFSGNQFSQAGTTRFFDDRPLPPGTTQIAFSYFLDPEKIGGEYVHRTVYATSALEVLMQPVSFELGAPFEDMGEVEFPNGRYRRWQLRDLSPGREVAIPLALGGSLRWTLKWWALGLALVGLIAGAAFGRLDGNAQPTPPQPAPSADRAALETALGEMLRHLARLDDQHASTPQDPDYRSQRQHLVEEALALYLRLEEPRADHAGG